MLQSAKVNLHLRYSLLKHYYNVFITQKGISSVFKPVFFVFPLDNNLYLDEIADTQFMIGNILMSAPILDEGKTARPVYFPDNQWYDMHTGKVYATGTQNITGVKITDKVPLFLRSGHALFTQNTTGVHQTKDLGSNFRLVAGMKKDSSRSNDTYQQYFAFGQMISINDYNKESNV